MRKEIKLLLLGFGLAITYFAIAWIFMPRIGDNVEKITGLPTRYESCSSRSCDYGISINEVPIACGVSAIGIQYSCKIFFKENITAEAKYFYMPTIFSVIGISNQSKVLIEMRQDGALVYHQTITDLRDRYFFPPSLVGIIIFILAFLGIKKALI